MAQGKLPRWSSEQLNNDRIAAQAMFVAERLAEGAGAFYEQVSRVEAEVQQAMRVTSNLAKLDASVLMADPTLWQVLRYFCAPPISEEDLWTMVGRKFKSTANQVIAEGAAKALKSIIDKKRFPWIATRSTPERTALLIAIKSTSMLLAHERFKTARRRDISSKQEDAIRVLLKKAGYQYEESGLSINQVGDLPVGSYSSERKIVGAKCDVPVRLRDGRLLALECKVSNGPKNSWKRLHREVGGKAERWKREYSSRIVIGAVLAGVFDQSCLEKSQDEHGVLIFWQHNLDPLRNFIRSGKFSDK